MYHIISFKLVSDLKSSCLSLSATVMDVYTGDLFYTFQNRIVFSGISSKSSLYSLDKNTLITIQVHNYFSKFMVCLTSCFKEIFLY